MKKPEFLKKGDKVGIVAASSTVNFSSLEIGINIIKEWGLEVVLTPTLGTSYFNFSVEDSIRKTELQSLISNPEIKAIIFARGGYGITRIIDEIDFSVLIQNPKWLVGFSDLTALLAHTNNIGLMSVHGPMVKTMQFDQTSNQYLYDILFGTKSSYTYKLESHKNNKLGQGSGLAIGGNLCMLNHTLGTPSEPDFNKAILFLEDTGEAVYAIDRFMLQLKRAKKLENLQGIVIGDFSDIKNPEDKFGQTIEEIVNYHCQEYSFPILCNFNFGHKEVNFPILIGSLTTLLVNDKGVQIEQVI